MTTTRPSYRQAINDMCERCVYDPRARGGWREQVADCGGISCPLYDVRPVPRDCATDGLIDDAKVAEVRRKLQRSTAAA